MQHRCVDKYRTWGFTVDWHQVWLNLHLWRFIRPVQDTSWLVAHGIFPTADRLSRFGMVVDPKCHCGQAESLLHLFVQCPVAARLLAWYFTIYQCFSPTATHPTPSEVLVGYGKGVKIPSVFPCLLRLIKHQLWLARNRARFDHAVLRHCSILCKVKSSLRFTIRMQQRNCPLNKFSELWLADGIFGTLSNADKLEFCEDFWLKFSFPVLLWGLGGHLYW
jgi:hypothetical protein